MIHYIYTYSDGGIYLHHAIDHKPSDNDYRMHTHDSCEILGCIRGKGKYVIEGSEYLLEPGCIYAVRPSETHRMYVDPSEPYERIMINFPYDILRQIDPAEHLLAPFLNRQLGEHNLYRRQDFARVSGMELLKCMVLPSETKDERRINALSNLYPLVNAIKNIFDEKIKNSSAPSASHSRQDTPRLIIDYINNHLHENLSLESLSERFFLSKSQISRIFKKATGSSVLDYIIIKRLMRAREYILDGKPAGEACQLCGFDHYSSFYRAYKKRLGVSPSGSKNMPAGFTAGK